MDDAFHLAQERTITHAKTRSDLGAGIGQLLAEAPADLDYHSKPRQNSEASSAAGNLVLSSGDGSLPSEAKAPFLIDTISGLEVRSSLLSREERAALQLIELRAKTARIRQSLPEWVRSSLVPPRRNPSPLAAAAVMAKQLADRAPHGSGTGGVQISCSVLADLGFLKDFQPAAGTSSLLPKLQEGALESMLLGVEQRVDVDYEPQPATGGQTGPLAGEIPSPAPPLGIGSALTWLFGALAECVSGCLLAVMGACCSGLGCLACFGRCPQAVSPNADSG